MSTGIQAQLSLPQPSPISTLNQKVGYSDITIVYSRPSAKGRKVFGDLVPFGEMWRTGANASTKITFSEEATIMGNVVPKGTYALYTIPGAKNWTIILHKDLTLSGTGGDDYKIANDLARFEVATGTQSPKQESFTITIDDISNKSASIILSWENTRVSIPFTVDTDTKAMADIKKILDGPTAGNFYSSANYYFEEGKDLSQASLWVDKAIEKAGEKYWYLRLKARIQAKLGDTKAALATIAKSSELAIKDGDKDYANANDKYAKEWMKK
jgi:hypothetical protein